MNEEELLKKLAAKDKEIADLKVKNLLLQEQVDKLNLLHFGKKSEKLTLEDKKQGSIFYEAEDSAFSQNDPEQEDAAIETVEESSYKKNVKKVGRKPISE